MAILEITSRQFRDNQKAFFDLADAGKQIVIRRKNEQAYALIPVSEDDLYFTPEMEAKIARAVQQIENGECTICETYEESLKHLESL